MDKIPCLIAQHLGDVTRECYDEYIKEEAKITSELAGRFDFKLSALETGYVNLLKAVRSYYTHSAALLTIAMCQKLQPTACHKQKKAMYFVAWMADWIQTSFFVINDICDGRIMRAGRPSVPVEVGVANAMSLFNIVTNLAFDVAEDSYSQQPWFLSFLKICRHHLSLLSIGMLVDTSSCKYDRMRDPKWYGVREYTSSTAPVGYLPLELAYCVAQKSMETHVGQTSLRLAHVLGSFGRTIDDVFDMESDTLAGRLNWAFWTAWQKANDEQRIIMLESGAKTPERLVKLYGELKISMEYETYATKTLQHLATFLDSCPDEIPKETWKSIPEYYRTVYTGSLGSTFHEEL